MLLGRYQVLRKIGSGGFGEVLLARAMGAEGFERIVALKRLKADLARKAGSLKGIINEARIGGLLNHPNIVQVLEFIHLEPDFLLVMEYVDGLSLKEILEMAQESHELLTPGLALDITIQTCEGLHHAHTARSPGGKPLKLVHRDIKPSNLMITRTGAVKIMDFGVARSSANTGQSSTGSIKGTLRYLSPEQAEGSREVGPQSDIFSLGLVLCEMIVGHPVYEADQEHLVLLKALQADTAATVEEAEQKVPGIGDILSRCLAVDPAARFNTAAALGHALRRLRKEFPLGTGLADMVEQAMADRKQESTRPTLSDSDAFSLELRLKGMDQWPPAGAIESPADAANDPSSSRDNFGDEPWEWEWRVTTYPSARSELEIEDDDFDLLSAHAGSPLPEAARGSTSGRLAPGNVGTAWGSPEVSTSAHLDPTPHAGQRPVPLPLPPGRERHPHPPPPPEAPDTGRDAERLPFVTDSRRTNTFWTGLEEHLWFQFLVGILIGAFLVTLGFLIGVRYATLDAPDGLERGDTADMPE